MQKKERIPVVLLAAGNGSRAGKIYKQFFRIHQKPLFLYSLEKFLALSWVGEIVFVVPQARLNFVKSWLQKNELSERVHIVVGAEHRRSSARKGLQYLVETLKIDASLVLIHDAARPIISKKLISSLRAQAQKHGASAVGIPAIDLLFQVKGGFIETAVNKQLFHYGFTPQCLPLSALWSAHQKAEKQRIMIDMDNIELLKKYEKNIRIKMIDNFYPNIKLTYKEDIQLLKGFLKNGAR